MKAQTGCKGIPILFNLGGRWGWVLNAKPRPLYPREKELMLKELKVVKN